MSAFAYIQVADVPRPLLENAERRFIAVTQENLIAFIGCPLTGTEIEGGEIMFPFPRAIEIRESLVSWFVHWGICFRVVM